MSIPANIIVAWSGTINEIPNGWLLCDGTNSTPDLRNRFIVGAGSTYALNDTGGFADATLPTHTHTNASNTDTAPNHTHTFSGGEPFDSPGTQLWLAVNGRFSGDIGAILAGGSHSHSLSITTVGENSTNKNLPPYYALAFIMKGAE